MDCYECKQELTWGSDNDYEDYGYEGSGIVATLTCPNSVCNVEMVMVLISSENNKINIEDEKKGNDIGS